MKIALVWGAVLLLWIGGSACNQIQSLEVQAAQTMAQTAWAQPWHGTWELTWQEAPISDSLIFIGWQTAQGRQRRFEILEAPLPSLVGLVYINDGHQARIFNRLEPELPTTLGDGTMPFSPLTDAFEQVTDLLGQQPHTATQRRIATPLGDGVELRLQYPQDQILILQMTTGEKLIIQATIEATTRHMTLIARSMTVLTQPHLQLFR